VTTTRKVRSLLRLRREVLMSLGALAFGIARGAGAAQTAPRPTWPIESAGGQAYLVGETYPRPTDWHDERIEALVPGCSVLWTETNQIIRGDLKELVTRNGIDNATPLMVRLGADDRVRLEKAAALCKVPMASLTNFRPWLAGATLEDAFYQTMGLSGLAPDKVLSAKAQAAGVPLFSEFAVKDDVVTWFGSMSPRQDLQFLRYILDEVLRPRAHKRQPHRLGAWRFPASERRRRSDQATLSQNSTRSWCWIVTANGCRASRKCCRRRGRRWLFWAMSIWSEVTACWRSYRRRE